MDGCLCVTVRARKHSTTIRTIGTFTVGPRLPQAGNVEAPPGSKSLSPSATTMKPCVSELQESFTTVPIMVTGHEHHQS